MKKTTVVNIYNFVRQAHEEPSRFIQDDFDTIASQIALLKQMGLPSTYALKHDALIDPRYQRLFLEQTDAGDEIGAWWEITGELCRRAGVTFRGKRGEVHDDRVATAYSLGYTPEERKRLVDAYMADFKEVFGYYPRTIGSWVIDIVTFRYAKEKYGIQGGALCRDQIGTDGFTLWGGYVNGAYYPSLKNEMIPAQTKEGQLDLPVFRLLGPDPIYSFEEGLQPGVTGVCSLEPSCVVGRRDDWVTWMFGRLTQEDCIGMSYAQVGQENNFLWENIEPGFELQLRKLQKLSEEGKVRIETMAETAAWFSRKYSLTPPATYQASVDWNRSLGLQTLWYCSRYYRISFLYEKERLFIRDWFVFDQEYPSRYLEEPLQDKGSIFDALPLLDTPRWKNADGRPKVELADAQGNLLCGTAAVFHAVSETEMEIRWQTCKEAVTVFLRDGEIEVTGNVMLRFTQLPVLEKATEDCLYLKYRGFAYQLRLVQGRICKDAEERICLVPSEEKLVICPEPNRNGETAAEIRGEKDAGQSCFTRAYREAPEQIDGYCPDYLRLDKRTDRVYPAAPPKFTQGDRVCLPGQTYVCTITGEGEIFYTLDGSEPNRDCIRYEKPFSLQEDTVIKARCYRAGFSKSSVSECRIAFGLPVAEIESRGAFDPRQVFNHRGAWDLLDGKRGSLDYQDGRWLGTTEDLDVVLTLPEEREIKSLRIGFLSHHRSGILYPDYVVLSGGTQKDKLEPIGRAEIPNEPGKREIERQDVVLRVEKKVKYLRLFAHNMRIQPDWACYRGLPGAFLMADSIIIK